MHHGICKTVHSRGTVPWYTPTSAVTTYFLSGSYYLEYPMGTNCSLWSRSGEQNYFFGRGRCLQGCKYLALCLPKIFSVLKLQDSWRRGAREGRTGGGTAKFDLTFNFFLLIWQKTQPATESYYFTWVPVSPKHFNWVQGPCVTKACAHMGCIQSRREVCAL